jgi:hypothetical protein
MQPLGGEVGPEVTSDVLGTAVGEHGANLDPVTPVVTPVLSPTPRADDGTRTRDPHLGKVMLYQLSHVRAVTPDYPAGGARRPSEARMALNRTRTRVSVQCGRTRRSRARSKASPRPMWGRTAPVRHAG